MIVLSMRRYSGGLQILCCQGFEVKYYDTTLDALL
jgi:hypothetical protein